MGTGIFLVLFYIYPIVPYAFSILAQVSNVCDIKVKTTLTESHYLYHDPIRWQYFEEEEEECIYRISLIPQSNFASIMLTVSVLDISHLFYKANLLPD